MSLRTFTTAAVDCDGPDCDEVLADVVPVSEDGILSAAQLAGWTATDDGRDYCPACSQQPNRQPARVAATAAA